MIQTFYIHIIISVADSKSFLTDPDSTYRVIYGSRFESRSSFFHGSSNVFPKFFLKNFKDLCSAGLNV